MKKNDFLIKFAREIYQKIIIFLIDAPPGVGPEDLVIISCRENIVYMGENGQWLYFNKIHNIPILIGENMLLGGYKIALKARVE